MLPECGGDKQFRRIPSGYFLCYNQSIIVADCLPPEAPERQRNVLQNGEMQNE